MGFWPHTGSYLYNLLQSSRTLCIKSWLIIGSQVFWSRVWILQIQQSDFFLISYRLITSRRNRIPSITYPMLLNTLLNALQYKQHKFTKAHLYTDSDSLFFCVKIITRTLVNRCRCSSHWSKNKRRVEVMC